MKKIVLFLFLWICHITVAQTVTIPDANFKAAIIQQGVDTNGDGEIQVSEAETITELNVQSNDISSLEGINSFVNLTNLNCGRNNLTSLDVSGLTQLTVLSCFDNQLTSLDESTLTNLTELNCYRNQLTSLDVSNLDNLIALNCGRNSLTSLVVSGANSLEVLECDINELTTLTLNNLPNIQVIDCQNNELTSLDVSNVISVKELNCRFNHITSLDATMLTNLEVFICHTNDLISLNVAGLSNLQELNCALNELTSLDLSGLTSIKELGFHYNQITSSNLINLENLTTLERLSCNHNNLTSLDASNLVNLTELYCGYNQLAQINVSNLDKVINFRCEHNQLTELDLSDMTSLEEIYCGTNLLTELDLSSQVVLDNLQCEENMIPHLDVSQTQSLRNLMLEDMNLETLSIKNGKADVQLFNYRLSGNPTLKHICVDSDEQVFIQGVVDSFGYTDCLVNPYCTFQPGGKTYFITGNVKVDIDQDGCDPDDLYFPFLQFKVADTNGNLGIYSTDSIGNYQIPLPSGSYNITYEFPYMSYFDITPPSFSANFPTDASPFQQDICLTPNGNYNDLQTVIIPLDEARPGFDTSYKIVYANVGTNLLSGDVSFTYQEDVLDFLTASVTPDSQSSGELSWSFTNLEPFDIKIIDVSFNLNTPTETPPLNGGDILTFEATISPTSGDVYPNDNGFTLNQTVVNSYDPNDKTCLEGDVITPDLVGEYVHYLIRFENTGSASAINVVIKDVIDTNKFDMTSFTPIRASHDFITRIQNGNEVEFIFEDIQLPFDDATNYGFVLFKIKTLPSLVLGDTFENNAEIYFDFNFPIITNVAQTTVDVTASTDDFTLNSNIKLFPNPAEDQVQIESQLTFDSVVIYDLTGKEIQRVVSTENRLSQSVDVSQLKSGVYYVSIQSGNSKTVQKFLKM